MFIQFILLVWCLFFNGFVDKCYNNVFADLQLNGGNPAWNKVAGVVDIFSWSGFLKAFIFAVVNNFLLSAFAYFFIAVMYSLYYAS